MKKILMCTYILASGSLTVRALKPLDREGIFKSLEVLEARLIPSLQRNQGLFKAQEDQASSKLDKLIHRGAYIDASNDEMLAGQLVVAFQQFSNVNNAFAEVSRANEYLYTQVRNLTSRIVDLEGQLALGATSKKVAHGKRRGRRRRRRA